MAATRKETNLRKRDSMQGLKCPNDEDSEEQNQVYRVTYNEPEGVPRMCGMCLVMLRRFQGKKSGINN